MYCGGGACPGIANEGGGDMVGAGICGAAGIGIPVGGMATGIAGHGAGATSVASCAPVHPMTEQPPFSCQQSS
jgi:hypothetical protein